jgi:antitoxin component YwqK of YwqJK toxin-antitoxin module
MKYTLLILLIFLSGHNNGNQAKENLFKDSIQKSAEHFLDSLKTQKDSDKVKRTYYKSGKLESEIFHYYSHLNEDSVTRTYYENGQLEAEHYNSGLMRVINNIKIWEMYKEYTETGQLRKEEFINAKDLYTTRIFDTNGKLESSECYYTHKLIQGILKSGEFDYVIKTYYENGKLATIEQEVPDDKLDEMKHGYFAREKYKMYSENGQLTDEQVVDYLPDSTGLEYTPRLVHEKGYKNGKISAIGDFYTNNVEGDIDSVGIWKIYDGKGQFKILKFDDSKSYYHP